MSEKSKKSRLGAFAQALAISTQVMVQSLHGNVPNPYTPREAIGQAVELGKREQKRRQKGADSLASANRSRERTGRDVGHPLHRPGNRAQRRGAERQERLDAKRDQRPAPLHGGRSTIGRPSAGSDDRNRQNTSLRSQANPTSKDAGRQRNRQDPAPSNGEAERTAQNAKAQGGQRKESQQQGGRHQGEHAAHSGKSGQDPKRGKGKAQQGAPVEQPGRKQTTATDKTKGATPEKTAGEQQGKTSGGGAPTKNDYETHGRGGRGPRNENASGKQPGAAHQAPRADSNRSPYETRTTSSKNASKRPSK